MLSPLLIKGTKTEFFPTWKREIDEKQTNLPIIQQTWTKNSVSPLYLATCVILLNRTKHEPPLDKELQECESSD